MENATYKKQLMDSLQKGNVQSVTFVVEGKETKMFLEANPKDRMVNVYDEKMTKQFQGIRQHKPELNQTVKDATLVNDQVSVQGLGSRGADSKEQAAEQKSEKKSQHIEPPVTKKAKRKSMSH